MCRLLFTPAAAAVAAAALVGQIDVDRIAVGLVGVKGVESTKSSGRTIDFRLKKGTKAKRASIYYIVMKACECR